MIPIALSYKIIKNQYSHELGEKYLKTIDLQTHSQNEIAESENADSFENFEIEPQKNMEEEIMARLKAEIEEEKKEMLESAAAEIEIMKEKAKKRGEEEGYTAGYKKGLEDARLEAETIKKNAIELFEDAKEKVNQYINENEERILNLAVKIAEKIANHAIENNAEGIMLLAKPVFEEYSKSENIIITCNPENLDFLKSKLKEIEKLCPNAHILILEDKNVGKNGIIIENENQIADLQIMRQLERFLELADR